MGAGQLSRGFSRYRPPRCDVLVGRIHDRYSRVLEVSRNDAGHVMFGLVENGDPDDSRPFHLDPDARARLIAMLQEGDCGG